ncbi:MAG: 2-oxoglutarate dehydrogenase E1 component [Planctomycetes bacterium]|nr:2-oxoglutarate dehydrogenase E1 component [Planctomycetota bacterium]
MGRSAESAGARGAASPWNLAYLDAAYRQWLEEPTALSAPWRRFFAGLERAPADAGAPAAGAIPAAEQSRVASLIYAYRDIGHRIAGTNPLRESPAADPGLELASFGFAESDLDRVFDPGHLHVAKPARLRDILAVLRETYCGSIGVEYLHVQDVDQRRWLQAEMEQVRNRPAFDRARRREILETLIRAEVFERFIHSRYPGQKRFSLEGAETIIPALAALVALAVEHGVAEIVLGMAHRGRLNVLTNVMGKSPAAIFCEFEGNCAAAGTGGSGDVKYHLGYSADLTTAGGRRIHLSLTANPSHLEAVNPVVEGRVRAKQRQQGDVDRRVSVVPVLIHGDAAFAGQGLVAETINLSRLPGYRTGGTVHFLINNQIGFTTRPEEGRSSHYPTDVAKTVEAPIFHVNGDDPDAMVFVTELALRYRQTFGNDVVVDMLCYRRHGHNEGDEPAYTQPAMYRKIATHPTVRERYTRALAAQGDVEPAEAEAIAAALGRRLQETLDRVRADRPPIEVQAFDGLWADYRAPYSDEAVDTRAPHDRIVEVSAALARIPAGLRLHPKLARWARQRHDRVLAGGPIDWALAEALAFGTLLLEGTPVRLSGQDSARGTFSQRHAVWVDTETEAAHLPLNHLRPGAQARFCVYNSSLSEAAVLGFDYGYSLSEPGMLILWEAQFGDFSNGAQVILDQFVTPSEAKWGRTSGIVLLLPHGYEGQGPDHSSAHLERYLAACAENNIAVCNLTTPANYFHALRRQVKRPFRRPLIVMAPKSGLRHPEAVTPVAALAAGGFEPVIADPAPPARARRVVLCSGKVYYDFTRHRRERGADDVACVRIEQLYPFPEAEVRAAVAAHGGAREVVWLQEEPQNRGAWSFMLPRLIALFPDPKLCYAGRPVSASAATGSYEVHVRQQRALLEAALAGGEEVPVGVARAARPEEAR